MGSCYKCGRVLLGDVWECEPSCPPKQPHHSLPSFEESAAAHRAQQQKILEENYVQIDWKKVTTFEDLKRVCMISFGEDLRINKCYPGLQAVAHLIMDKKT